MYLAYHEGRGGYARGSYNAKPEIVQLADRVDWQAREYGAQLLAVRGSFQVPALVSSRTIV